MKITSGFRPQIEVMSSKSGIYHWLVNSEKKRITPKFKTISHKRVGMFTELRTNKGNFVYNVCQRELLYANDNSDDMLVVRKIDEHLYAIGYGKGLCRKTKLYTETGALLREFTAVGELKNGLITVQKDAMHGFIDEDANVIIPFVYFSATDFNEYGYAVVSVEEDLAAKTVIDKNGNQLFPPIKCGCLYFVSETHLEISKRSCHGIIDINGKEIIPAIYSIVVPIADFYKVAYKGKWGLFDKNGKELFEPIYDEIIETTDKFVVKDFAKIEVAKTKEILKDKEE